MELFYATIERGKIISLASWESWIHSWGLLYLRIHNFITAPHQHTIEKRGSAGTLNQPWHLNCAGKTTVQFRTSIEPTYRWMWKASIDTYRNYDCYGKLIICAQIYLRNYDECGKASILEINIWYCISRGKYIHKGRKNLLYANHASTRSFRTWKLILHCQTIHSFHICIA